MQITRIETVSFRNVTEVHAGGIGWTWVRIHSDTGAHETGETFPAPEAETAVILRFVISRFGNFAIEKTGV